MAQRQAVFSFNQGDNLDPLVRGGKGAGLAVMASLRLPVPPGFTITSGVGRAYAQEGCLPNRVESQIQRELAKLELQTGKKFGSVANPLLISVRSGAAVSMPGMMDSILNVGLTKPAVAVLSKKHSRAFGENCYRRLTQNFQNALGYEHAVLDDPRLQLRTAIELVFKSWNSERAIEYRKIAGVPAWWQTAINVQAMVFGNLNDRSATGVVFSRNVATGDKALYGEFLVNAQGEDLVSGVANPLPIQDLESWNPAVYEQLSAYAVQLENHFKDVVDIEFTVEDGKLYLLQVRVAKRSARAAIRIAVQRVWEGKLSKPEALESVSAAQIESVLLSSFDEQDLAAASDRIIGGGLPASPGAVVGVAATTVEAAKIMAAEGKEVVLVRPDTLPEDLPGMLVSKAVVTFNGGATSHSAVVSRSLNIPAVVGVQMLRDKITDGMVLSVDGSRGLVISGSVFCAESNRGKEIDLFLRWKHFGIRKITNQWTTQQVSMNIVLAEFYLTDRMAHRLRDTPLGEKAAKLKAEIHRNAADLLATYLVEAVASEVGHIGDRYFGTSDTKEAERFILRLSNGGGPGYRSKLTVNTTPVFSGNPKEQRQFFEAAATIFRKGDWSSSYGGVKWAAIAEAGIMYVEGGTNDTVFVDYVFDLRHNTGAIFDKHEMVAVKTRSGRLISQLDGKKNASNMYELWANVKPHTFPDSKMNERVTALFEEGDRLGYWRGE